MSAETEAFYNRYQRNGLRFPRSVLTRYALSLYTKPFVILSGISGTGKTKIAQLFEVPKRRQPPPAAQVGTGGGRMVMTATEGVLRGDGRGNLSKEYMSIVFETEELEEIRIQSERIVARGAADNVIAPIKITLQTPEGDELTLGMYVQRPSSPLIRLRAKSKAGEIPAYDSRPYLAANYNVGDPIELEKIGPHRFRIVVAQNDVERQEQAEAAAVLQFELESTVENRLFIPVQSDWLDRAPLFGALNQITGHYEVTAFLKFVLTAATHPGVPFFAILDEMNLSKVEHYFSDFLSCLESRIVIEGKLNQEPIILHDRGVAVPTDNDEIEEVPSRLKLPPNLYVTGSVNVDETTYMFSPKVLDRANVIEFNEVDLDILDDAGGDDESVLVLDTIPPFGANAPAGIDAYQALSPENKALLKDLIAILRPYSLHFGYRVANEIAAFIRTAIAHCADNDQVPAAAMDAQIVQKILPKFSGSQAQLEEPLRRILIRLMRQPYTSATMDPEMLTVEWLDANTRLVAGLSYPLSGAKLVRMLRDLQVRGFTSFIG